MPPTACLCSQTYLGPDPGPHHELQPTQLHSMSNKPAGTHPLPLPTPLGSVKCLLFYYSVRTTPTEGASLYSLSGSKVHVRASCPMPVTAC